MTIEEGYVQGACSLPEADGSCHCQGWNQSISPASASPLGSMNEVHTRKLLINMILTLNNTFADYDFRDLKPEDFVREASLEMVLSIPNISCRFEHRHIVRFSLCEASCMGAKL